MKLNVPRFEQENDWFCGPAVLQSVLAYYGINKSQKEIARESNSTKKYGSFLSDMVAFARKSGLKTNLILFDTEIIDPTWTKLSKKKLVEKLSKRLRTTKPNKKGNIHTRAYQISEKRRNRFFGNAKKSLIGWVFEK